MQDMKRSLMLGCSLLARGAGFIRPGRIYAFGPYIPVNRVEHWGSSWSQMVLQAKRHDNWILLNVGRILAAHIEQWLNPEERYVMTHVPAPSPNSRSHPVGNQTCTASRLSDAISEAISGPPFISHTGLLTMARRKRKKQRRCVCIAEREENVRGCYQARSETCLGGGIVILVDDVVTTGATMRECALALLKAGASGVIGIAMARTVHMDPFSERNTLGYMLYPGTYTGLH